jgi:CubicO group peptidase (beta-lactamase class C family)
VNSTVLRTGSLSDLGISPDRWSVVESLAAQCVASGDVPRLVLQVVRHGQALEQPLDFAHPESARPSGDAPLFLVASLTKPIVVLAALRLVERGELSLSDRVVEYLPEFDDPAKRPITVRHLMAHTSGLPDMLPTNRALRMSRSPLTAFVSGTCGVTLDFPPGRGVQYQSMGFAVLGAVIERVTGRSCGEIVRRELFEPLELQQTCLGAPDGWFDGPSPIIDRVAEVRVPPEQQGGEDWNWNSRYWRQLGSPWGGMLSTAADLAVLCGLMLRQGVVGSHPLLAAATVALATGNRLHDFRDVPEADRRTRPWGLGWRLNWPAHEATFGDLLSPAAYGHWGATGCLFWIDPVQDGACIVLTTEPLDTGRNRLTRLSNAVVAAWR